MRPLGGAIGEGLRFVLGHPLVRPVVLGSTGGSLCSNILVSIAALFVTRELGLAAWVYGLVIGVGGPAALIGAIVTGRAIARFGIGKTLIGTALLSSVATAPLALADDSPGVAIALLVGWRVCTALAEAIGGIGSATLLQTSAPPELLGCVNATQRVFAWGAVALGGLLGGALGETLGLRATVAVAVAGMLLSALWLLTTPLRTVRVVQAMDSHNTVATARSPRNATVDR